MSLAPGKRLALAIVGLGIAVAALRTVCVPVGSFKGAIDTLEWSMPSVRVVEILGEPNRICVTPSVAHLEPSPGADPGLMERLAAVTGERWIYHARPPKRPVPRRAGTTCHAGRAATELGFDRQGRLLWRVAETGRTPLVVAPTLRQAPKVSADR